MSHLRKSRTKSSLILVRTMAAAILLGLPILFHCFLPVMSIVPKPWNYPGIVLMLVGFALATWAAGTFRRIGTSFQLHGDSSILVTSGPFSISRNPMYVSMLLWLLGFAVLLGSLSPFLFPVLLFIAANFLIIPLEERNMEAMFGDLYIRYKQRVRRWI